MKLNFLLLSFLLQSSLIYSQEDRTGAIYVTPYGGASYVTSFAMDSKYDRQNTIFAADYGVSVQYFLGNYIGLQTGIEKTTTGFQSKGFFDIDEEFKETYQYVGIPLLFHAGMNEYDDESVSTHLSIGPKANFLMSSEDMYQNSLNGDLKKMYFSLELIAGMDIYLSERLNLRLQEKNSIALSNIYTSEKVAYKPVRISVIIGLVYKIF